MSTTLPIVNSAGQKVGSFEIPDSWLEREKGEQAVHDSVVAFRAAGRAGTACTKTKGNVSGGGAKPWRQKGTGRARAGSSRSPVWRGGGIIFGPLPRSYAKKLNKKVRRLAMRRVLADRIAEGAVVVVDDLALATPRTQGFAGVLDAIGVGPDTLIIANTGLLTSNLVLASRNMPMVNLVSVDGVSVYHLMLHPKVLFTREALAQFGARITSASDAAEVAE